MFYDDMLGSCVLFNCHSQSSHTWMCYFSDKCFVCHVLVTNFRNPRHPFETFPSPRHELSVLNQQTLFSFFKPLKLISC